MILDQFGEEEWITKDHSARHVDFFFLAFHIKGNSLCKTI